MKARIAVVGTGYVGTVVAACFAELGFAVTGLEVDEQKLADLRRGRAPFFEAGLDDLLRRGVSSGRLSFTGDATTAVGGADAVFLCVGTPPLPDGRPDMRAVQEAAATIARALTGPTVLVTKSTVPIGSGRWLMSVVEDAVLPQQASHAISVVSNPEFLRQGSAINDFIITHITTALGLDARVGPRFLDAGLGWGGSCFGKDLNALVAIAGDHGYTAELLRASIEVNGRQRQRVVEKVQSHLKTLMGRRVGILGLAFKPGTDDLRDAPAVDIIRTLVRCGCIVTAHDPVVRRLPQFPEVTLAADPLAVADRADAVILVTDWPEYVGLDLAALRARMRGDLLVDGRNVFQPRSAALAGFHYESMGRNADLDAEAPGREDFEQAHARHRD